MYICGKLGQLATQSQQGSDSNAGKLRRKEVFPTVSLEI
jgi:hypothetical protein